MEDTPVLLTDGGSSAEQTTAESDGESEEQAEAQDEEHRMEDMSADAVAGDEEGAEVLFLDLHGLDLSLLGLDVSLSEVVLDVSAVEGEDNLLGNLLSAVTGLLDGGLGSLLDGLALDFDIKEKVRSVYEDVKQSLGDAIDEVPVGEVLTQVFVGVITQLLGLDGLLDDSEDGDESDDESESSGESGKSGKSGESGESGESEASEGNDESED